MFLYLEKIGVSLEDLKIGKLVMVGQDGDIIEPYEWQSEIVEGVVVRLAKPENHNIVYWRDASGTIRISVNDKFRNGEYVGQGREVKEDDWCEVCGETLHKPGCKRDKRTAMPVRGCQDCGAMPHKRCAMEMKYSELATMDAIKPRKLD